MGTLTTKEKLELEPNNASLNLDYALYLLEEYDYEEAEKYFEKALEIEPNSSYFHFEYAKYLTEDGDYNDKSMKHFEKSLEIEPNSYKTNLYYAVLLKRMSKKQEAVNYFKKALELNLNGEVCNEYALFLKEEKRVEEAKEYFEIGLKVDPLNIDLNYHYAEFLLDIKNEDKAIEFYYKTLKLDYEYIYRLDFFVDIIENFELIKKSFEEFLEKNPHKEFYSQYASFLENKNEFKSAKKFHKKALDLDIESTNKYYNTNYANILVKLKEYKNVEEYYKKGFDFKDWEDSIAPYIDFLKEVKKDFKSIENIFENALKKEPHNSIINQEYAKFLATQNEKDKANILFQKSIINDFKEDYSYNIYEYIEFAKSIERENKEIDLFLQKLLEENQNNETLIVEYANFLVDIKEYSRAEKLFYKVFTEYSYVPFSYIKFLKDRKKDTSHIDKFYENKIKETTNIRIIRAYIDFLEEIEDYDKADIYYKKTLEIEIDNHWMDKGYLISQYALFLSNKKRDFQKAKKYYLKAIEKEDDNIYYYCIYTVFLTNITKEFNEAKKYYLKGLEIEPTYLTMIGNFAGTLFALNERDEAIFYFNKVFKKVKNHRDLYLELLFYKMVYFENEYNSAKEELTKRLEEGDTSLNWDFSIHLENAKKNNHKYLQELKEYATKISKLEY